MCGIAGIYNFKNDSKVDVSQVKTLTDTLIHRGPDGEGQWVNSSNTVGLGHRRLSILDLREDANQPMHLEERFSLVFNGEIYNYVELREPLLKEGIKFKTSSDTEVLIHLFYKYREKCLPMLDGMFAFAIWDDLKKELFFARDRFGEKPFYYSEENGQLVFASEIKAITALQRKKNISKARINDYLHQHNLINPKDIYETFYDGVREFPNASYCTINENGISEISSYWKLDESTFNTFTGTFQEAKETFHALLFKSVKYRLRSDVPVGSSLSGGLDSSAIIKFIQLAGSNEVNQKTFSARFPGFKKDEGKFIQLALEALDKNEHFECAPNSDFLKNNLEKLIYHQEEPFGSASIAAQFNVMKLAKENGITVMLDGQGADEFLAGYLYFYKTYFKQLFWSDRSKFNLEMSKFSHLRPEHPEFFSAKKMRKMKLDRFQLKLRGKTPYFDKLGLKNHLNQKLNSVGLRTLLRYADRNAMANSIETRLPFLSHELIEFVFTLPDDFLLSGGWTKRVLRETIHPYFDKELTWRVEKVGYEPPQKNWLNADWVNTITEPLSKEFNINPNENSGVILRSNKWKLLMVHYIRNQ